MGFWRDLFGRQERAAYTRTDGNLLVNDSSQFVWTGYDSGGGAYPIGPNGPFSVRIVPAVTRLTALITDPLSTVPWSVLATSTGSAVGGDLLDTPRWLTDPQLLRPDSRYPYPPLPYVNRQPRATFYAAWIRAAAWHGMGTLAFAEDETGQPMPGTLRLLNPVMIRPVRNDAGETVWEVGAAPETVRADRDGYLPVTFGSGRWRLLTLRDPHAPVDDEGRSVPVFERHADTFGIGDDIDHYTGGVYRSGVPSGYLKVNTPGLQQSDADDLKRKWMEAHGGDRRSVAVLNSTTDYTPIMFSPIDAALVESKRANLADLAMAFSLDPVAALGVSMGNSATYANVQQHFARLRTDLMPWITAIEQTLGALLPVGRDIRMDFSEYARPDPKDQYEGLKTALDAGLLTVNEARGVLGLPPTTPPPLRVVPPPAPPQTESEQEQPDTEEEFA